MLWAVTDVFFDTLWNVMWRNVWRSYKHIERSTHCENILYQGHKGNKGRRMLEERWTVLAANEKMTQVDTISINMLWKIALVLFLCETLVWETTQRAALFWSINFNTLTFEASFYFWTRRTIWSPTLSMHLQANEGSNKATIAFTSWVKKESHLTVWLYITSINTIRIIKKKIEAAKLVSSLRRSCIWASRDWAPRPRHRGTAGLAF